ncbi:MAG: 2,3-dimethylmalate dehydratase small subunit [Pseudomonadota bacterium]
MSQTRMNGQALVLGDAVNTDIHCSSKYLPGKDNAFVAAHAFEKLSAGFPDRVRAATSPILVAGEHFGINSSREQAAHVLREMGVRAVIAKSFARAFYRNGINNGLALLACSTDDIQEGDALCIDLASGKVEVSGRPDRFGDGLPPVLLDLIAEGGLLNYLARHGGWPDQASSA